MSPPLPPIYRDCRRLLVHTEEAVRRFSRYHKYTVGTDLRQSAMGLMRTVNQAVHDKPRQIEHVQQLVWRVDEFKLTLQLAMDIGAFAQSVKTQRDGKTTPAPSFAAFEQVAMLAQAVGKQCGGWLGALARGQARNQVGSDHPNDPAAGPPQGRGNPLGEHGGETAAAGSKHQPLAALPLWLRPLGPHHDNASLPFGMRGRVAKARPGGLFCTRRQALKTSSPYVGNANNAWNVNFNNGNVNNNNRNNNNAVRLVRASQ
jgi:hypothetical protein